MNIQRYALRTLTVLTAAVIAVACSGSSEEVEVVTREAREVRTIAQSGLDREYIVHYPANMSSRSAWPVVMAFHPAFATAADFERISGLHAAPGAENFIVVYPNGFRRSWNVGDCCGSAQERGLDDVGFSRAIMQDLATVAPIEPRAHVTGLSNGAMLVYRLVCEHADMIAAAAPAGGTIELGACNPSRPVPVMHLHGEEDRFAPIDGGMSAFERVGVQPSVEDGITRLASANRCDARPGNRRVGGIACEDWSGCAQGADVLLCVIPDLGHLWPGAGQGMLGRVMDLGPSRTDIDGSAAILEFFMEQR